MFKKFFTNTTFLWILSLIIITEGLILSNLELAPTLNSKQPAVLGIKTENNQGVSSDQLDLTTIEEIKNKIQKKIDSIITEKINDQKSIIELNNQDEQPTDPSLNNGGLIKNEKSSALVSIQNQNNSIPRKTEITDDKDDKIESLNENKTEEQLKMEEINDILNQPEHKINLKKYQPALEVEIFNPIKKLIQKNIEIFKTLTK